MPSQGANVLRLASSGEEQPSCYALGFFEIVHGIAK